ncbi:MAG: adenosine kinase [Planctomycetaceae bacterium]
MKYNVFGVGNALVDVQAHVNDTFLEQVGYAKGMMTLVDESTQRDVLERLDGVSVSRCAGGSAANTIIGLAGFGGSGAFAGKVANDEVGKFFVEDMRRLGVRNEAAPVEGGQSGTCVVLITDDAQRTMLTNLAASSDLGPDDICRDEIAKADYVYIEGYLFTNERNRAAALKAMEYAVEAGVKVAFTASDPFLIQYHRDEFLRLIEGPVDLLFCNLEEARALTGKHDAIECAHEIHKHAENVALTMGEEGSLLMHDGEAIPIEGVAVKAVDTTGAGDMYAAAILYGITNGLSWRQAGRLASHAAARVVGQLGARLATPFTAEEVQRIVNH